MSLRAWRLVARAALVTGCSVPSDSAGSSDTADTYVADADTYVADLHIHSRFSRACSRDLTLPNLAWWARRKGIALLGTGDFTLRFGEFALGGIGTATFGAIILYALLGIGSKRS